MSNTDERAALERIANMVPAIDSIEGDNEWGAADCFRQAQSLACKALAALSAAPAEPAEETPKTQAPCGGRSYCGRFPFCGCGGPDPLPERDPSKPAEQQGVFRKFEVRRVDGSDKPGGKHEGCEYFVLDVDHDPHAKVALAAYAGAAEATHPQLAEDMRDRYDLPAALSAAPAEPAQIGTVEIVGGRVRSYSFEQTDVPTGEYRMCVAAPSPQPAAKRPNCRDVPPGNGFCDMCAAGHYERCRYVVPLSQSAAIERLTEDQRMTLRDVIADSLGSTAYFCTRVWEAWNVGTMSRDDFHPITEDNDALLHIVDVVEAALYPRVIERELSRVPDGCHKLDTDRQAFFYEQDFYVLSNFSSFNLEWDGMTFQTSEAAYHWEKFAVEHDDDTRNSIAYAIYEAPSAHAAFKIAEANRLLRRADWDDVKVDIMRNILRAKAAQHEYVRRKLLATGDRELVEDSWRDDFWGWGPDRKGQNMLGKLWMEVRAELRAAPTPGSP